MGTVYKIDGEFSANASTTTFPLKTPELALQAGQYTLVAIGGVFVWANTTNQTATFALGTAIVNDDGAYVVWAPANGPTAAAGTTGWCLPSVPGSGGGIGIGESFLDWLRPTVTFATAPAAGSIMKYSYYIIVKQQR